MSDLIAPLEGAPIKGKCIDEAKTQIHEDLFRITQTSKGTQIDIACVIPPSMPSRKKLTRELNITIKNRNIDPLGFFEKYKKRDYDFGPEKPRDALVATYILDTKKNIVLEEMSRNSVIGEIFTYEEYSHSPSCEKDHDALIALLKRKRKLYAKVESDIVKWPEIHGSIARQNVVMAMNIFNDTCRRSATHAQVPFIWKNKMADQFFLLNHPNAKFNCSLRDPQAFFNASNLADYLSNVPIIYDIDYLARMKPVYYYTRNHQQVLI